MSLGDRFVPGKPKEFIPGDPFWPPFPEGVASGYVKDLSPPGSLVLIPFSLNPLLPLEILDLGYKVIASSFNPVPILCLRALHNRGEDFTSALTRLVNAPRGEMLLRHYLQSLYLVECPGCGELVEAEFFLWEGRAPTAKAVKCPKCGTAGTFPLVPTDLKPLENLKERGPDYWYVLARLFSPGEVSPPEAEELPLVYTPRNLHCLNAMFVKIEALFPEKSLWTPAGLALKAALLAAMHLSLSLYPSPEFKGRPVRLHLPPRFVEANAWKAFQSAAESLRCFLRPLPVVEQDEFFRKDKASALLPLPWGIKKLEEGIPPSSASFLILEPPPLDRTWWALNFLWAGWLMGYQAAYPLRTLALKGVFGWDWYEETLRRSLLKLKGLLKPGGFALFVGQDIPPVMAECLILAGAKAGLRPESFSFRERDTRLEVRLLFSNSEKVWPLTGQSEEETLKEAILEVLSYSAEPLTPPLLRLAVEWWLSSRKPWAWGERRRGEFRSFLEEVLSSMLRENSLKSWADGKLLGLPQYPSSSIPLSDKTELEVYRLLREKGLLTLSELEELFYTSFQGPLAPKSDFLRECLASYGEEAEGKWRLRVEDEPEMRARDQEEIKAMLWELGEKLGFQVREGARDPFDVIWEEKEAFGKPLHLIAELNFGFVVESTAALTGFFLRHFSPPFPRSYVVIPGGRASLVWYKLKNMPLWSSLKGWQFIKYRHLRRLAQEKAPDRYSLQKIIGLDPVVERPGAQLSFI
jgi:hypothetical protein